MRLLFMLLPPRVAASSSSFAFVFASSRDANSVASVPPRVASFVVVCLCFLVVAVYILDAL